MSHETSTKWVCDRCGMKLRVRHSGGSTPQLPDGWKRWDRRRAHEGFEVCERCDVRLLADFGASLEVQQ